MKALVICDKYVEDVNEKAKDCDVVFGLGDLNMNITEIKEKPFFFIPGNHDDLETVEFELKQLPNVQNIHMKVVDFMGYKIGGFGGSIRYRPGKNMYTEEEVKKYLKDFPYVDIFLAHNSPVETEIPDDHIHKGFQAFSDYIKEKQPKLFLHGHINESKEVRVGNTLIKSTYGYEEINL